MRIAEIVNEDASRIGRRAWRDPEVYALEQRAIFGRAWLFLGHESQIRAPGDFVQAYMGETPIILSRGPDHAIHANVNSCTHRGLPVCRADHGNTTKFVCPYHNWCYDVTGRLVAIPQERHVEHRPDKNELGLKRVPRVESWNGLVFGCFDAGAPSLDDYLGNMRFYLHYSRPGTREFLYAGQRNDVLLRAEDDYRILDREIVMDMAEVTVPTLGLFL